MFPPVKYSLNLPTAPAEEMEGRRVAGGRKRRRGELFPFPVCVCGVRAACTLQTSRNTLRTVDYLKNGDALNF